jgi:hypothetical protein
MMQAPDGAMTNKRKVQTKYKLPTLNWIALKQNQVRVLNLSDIWHLLLPAAILAHMGGELNGLH